MNYDAHQQGVEVLRIHGVNNAQEEEALRKVAAPLRAAEDAVEGEIEEQDAAYFEQEGADFMDDDE
jgi:hypothetical protein